MALIDTYRGVAQPWLCDIMGHLNVRHYVGHFDDASWHLLAALGYGPEVSKAADCGWADVRATIEYKDEVRLGELFRIKSGLVRLGTTSVTILHHMTDPAEQTLHATMEVVTVHFDLKRRRSIALPDALRSAAERIGCMAAA